MRFKKSFVKSLYDWKTFVFVILIFSFIEIGTSPFGRGYTGFPFNTCTAGSTVLDNDGHAIGGGECNYFNIIFNLIIYYIVIVISNTLIKMEYSK
jgi:hypothetical protein